MNNKGNIYASVMVALILFMVGMTVVNFIMPEVASTRAQLDCSNAAGITNGTKLMCLNVDIVVVYFIVLVLSISGGVIFEKVLS